jgi:hypothetical protein
MQSRALASVVVIVLTVGLTACGNARQKTTAAVHLRSGGLTKKDVLAVAGTPNRLSGRCWIYFPTKPSPARIRYCFTHGRVSFLRTVFYK